MTAAISKSRWRAILKYLLILAVAGMLALGGLLWYTTTDSFRNMVRSRIVAELERVTGGRAEFDSFHIIPFRFRVEIRGLTIHGREAPGEVPLVHVDSLLAQVKIVSALSAQFGFNSVIVDHPTVHILIYPDGSSNQPRPQLPSAAPNTSVQKLFALSINRFEVRHGKLLWNDQQTPLDFVVTDLSADMAYSLLRRRYESDLLLGKIETKFDGFRPIAWMAEVHFNLGRSSVEVKSLKATSGRSHLEATGRLQNFRRPIIEGKYEASIDLEEASATARRPEIQHGTLQLTGAGKWTASDFSSAGTVLVKDLDFRNGGLGPHLATVAAQYAATPQRLALSRIEGKALGGSIAGEAEITNWQSSAAGAKLAKGRVEQKGTVRLKFKDASIAEAADLISTRDFPLRQLNFVGIGAGTLEARWAGSASNFEASVALDVVPPARASPPQIPLTAHGLLTYRGGRQELEIADLIASTRATQVQASGILASGGSMKLLVGTTDLSEWQPALRAFHATLPLPAALHGRATFNGTASGKLTDITLAGNLQAEDFEVTVPATSRTPGREAHWDSLNVNVQLSPQMFTAHNGTLREGDTELSFDFSTALSRGHFTDKSAINARLDMHKADAASVLALAGLNYPVTGTLNLHMTASGPKSSLAGEGHILLTGATLYGRPVERLESDIRISGEEAQLNNALVAFYDSQLTGSAGYNFSSGTIRLDVNGKNLDLARVPPQFRSARFDLQGRADFTAHASGTLAQPSVSASVHLRDLSLAHQPLGGFTFDAATQGESAHVTGHSQFQQADLTLDGTVRLRGDWPCEVNIQFKELDVAPLLLAGVSTRVTHSVLTGHVQVQGPLFHPAELKVTGALDGVRSTIQDVEVHNDGPIHFSVSNQLLQVEQFHLSGPRTDLSGSGTIHLAGNRELDLRAHGRANLRLIESFNHDFTTSGQVTVDLTVVGTLANPIAQGRLQVSNGNFAYSDLPSGLSETNGTLVFNQSRVQIESLTARTGGGSVTLSGFATLQNGRLAFDLSAHGTGVRLRYPPGISSTADVDVRFAGTSDSSTLSGNVTVTKLSVTPGFDFGAYLARTAQTTALPEASPLLNHIRLDVHIATTPELQMQTTQLRLSGDADLRLRGTAAKPSLLGRAEVIEGDVYFNGTKYHLERGDVNFVPPGIQPVFDLQMSTQVRDYDVTVGLTGPLNKLTLSYRSEPPLPEADIVALLALGRTREESAQLQQASQSPFNQEASSAILSEALNAVVSNRVQRLFGGSRIKIDPQGLNTETNPSRGPQVTIEQQVTRSLTLTYSTAVSQSSQQIIQMEYNLSHNVSIVALRDQNGVVSFDVRIRQRRK